MNIEAIIDEIARYLEWNQALPFGSPNDIDTYREHLLVQELKRKEMDRHEG